MTSVRDSRRLSDRQVIDIYRQRRGIKLFWLSAIRVEQLPVSGRALAAGELETPAASALPLTESPVSIREVVSSQFLSGEEYLVVV